MKGHSVNGVAVTADGRRAVSASQESTLKVWDLESGSELWTLEGHSASVHGVAVTPDGRRAVSASADSTLKVWDLENGRELRTLEGHSSAVTGVAVTPDGRRAVSASGDKTVKVWDRRSGRVAATFTCDAAVNCVAVGAQIIAAGDQAGRVHFLTLEE
jgi:WD40 repeat protein